MLQLLCKDISLLMILTVFSVFCGSKKVPILVQCKNSRSEPIEELQCYCDMVNLKFYTSAKKKTVHFIRPSLMGPILVEGQQKYPENYELHFSGGQQ